MKFINQKTSTVAEIGSWAWFFESRPTYCDFEIGLSTLQLHQIFKPIRILTRTKRYTDQVYIYSKLIHIWFLAILKNIFRPSSSTTSLFTYLFTCLFGWLVDWLVGCFLACLLGLAWLGLAWLGLAWLGLLGLLGLLGSTGFFGLLWLLGLLGLLVWSTGKPPVSTTVN